MEPDEVVRLIDGALRERALVLGSLPPGGRDLDLVVDAGDEAAVAERLRGAGFVECGRQWITFAGCSAYSVDLISPASLGLPPAELHALLVDAVPLAGARMVVEPSPHHTLLIVAGKVDRARGRLEPKHRLRVARALDHDPRAWDVARQRAGAWGAARALQQLEELFRHEVGTPLNLRMLVRRPSHSRVVALSSPDAAATARHAEALERTLERLGFDAVVARCRRPPHRRHGARAYVGAATDAVRLWIPVWRHVGRGRILICDGHMLDAAVELDDVRPVAAASLAKRSLRLLSPRPAAAYLLDVPGRSGRRDESYRVEATRARAQVIDAGRPRADVCAELGAAVWRDVRRRGS